MATEINESKTATCIHNESIANVRSGVNHGTCKLCGQIREYDLRLPDKPPRIIKLGRLDNRLILPYAEEYLNLTTQEMKELNGRRTPKTTPEKLFPKTKAETPQAESVPADIVSEKAEKSLIVLTVPPPKPPPGNSLADKKALGQYYADNKELIVRDFYELLKSFDSTVAQRKLLTHWGMSSSGWRVLRAKWMPDRFVLPTWAGRKTGVAGDRPHKKATLKKNADLEEHKAEVIGDYKNLPLKVFLKKWHISPYRWAEIKTLWDLKGKRPGRLSKKVLKAGKATSERLVEVKEVDDLIQMEKEVRQLNEEKGQLEERNTNQFNKILDLEKDLLHSKESFEVASAQIDVLQEELEKALLDKRNFEEALLGKPPFKPGAKLEPATRPGMMLPLFPPFERCEGSVLVQEKWLETWLEIMKFFATSEGIALSKTMSSFPSIPATFPNDQAKPKPEEGPIAPD